MGGRTADVAGADFTNPFEYNPATNTWVTKAAIFPDNKVNNMACGVLTVGGTPQIYCVGGSASARRWQRISCLQLQPRDRHDHCPDGSRQLAGQPSRHHSCPAGSPLPGTSSTSSAPSTPTASHPS